MSCLAAAAASKDSECYSWPESQKNVGVLIEHISAGVTLSCYGTMGSRGCTASCLLINFRAHKLLPLLFRICDMIWDGTLCFHSPFITVSRRAATCSEWREQNWSKDAFSPDHAWSLLSWICFGWWAILISKRYLVFSTGSPPNAIIRHPSSTKYPMEH